MVGIACVLTARWGKTTVLRSRPTRPRPGKLRIDACWRRRRVSAPHPVLVR